jgi:hypothetical protein
MGNKRMNELGEIMKNKKTKALAVLLALPILGGFLFMGCGDDGGGDSTINPGITPPTNFSLSYPADQAAGVCTFPTFKVHFPEHKDCGIQDLSKVIGIFPTGANQTIGVSQAFQSPASDGGCDYTFNAAQSIAGLTQVKWGIMTSSSGISLDPKFATFTTADANLVDCGGNGTRFVLSSSNPESIAQGSTDIGNFGVYDASTGKLNFDGGSLLNFLTNNFLSVGQILGFGTGINRNAPIILTFNQRANLPLLTASIVITEIRPTGEVDGKFPKLTLGNSISGYNVAEVGTAGGFQYAINPPSSGWSPGMALMVFVNKTAVSAVTGQPLADKNNSTARSYAGRVNVAQ